MKFLKAIGGFFARIGRWIRDTAWVQPLLIVGGIFAVIFSIPYIVDAAKANAAGGNESETFYAGFKKSLDNADERTSEADKLFYYLEERKDGTATDAQIKEFGDQFFVTFVQKGCAGCEEVYKGFQTLQQNWNTSEFIPSKDVAKEFKMYTIVVDEDTDDKELSDDDTSFSKYFYTRNHGKLFDYVGQGVLDRPYRDSMDDTATYDSNIDAISDIEAFQTPTTFMVDFNFEDAKENYGVADILFNFDGKDNKDGAFAQARTLIDCWNHQGVFENKNA